MSMSRSEERIVEILRAVGRMRATVVHVIACSGTVDEELTAMAEELETLQSAFSREHKEALRLPDTVVEPGQGAEGDEG